MIYCNDNVVIEKNMISPEWEHSVHKKNETTPIEVKQHFNMAIKISKIP